MAAITAILKLYHSVTAIIPVYTDTGSGGAYTYEMVMALTYEQLSALTYEDLAA